MSRPHVLVIDNYDSFTYNLVQGLMIEGANVTVCTSDQVSPSMIDDLSPSHLVVSPGPGRPENAGATMQMIDFVLGRMPILGVCLGHQALAMVCGGRVGGADTLMHGKTSLVRHDSRTVFAGLPDPFPAGRYHSLAVSADDLPSDLEVTATTDQGEVMGIRHVAQMAEGIQFHPESILTPDGPAILRNFLDMGGLSHGAAPRAAEVAS